MSIATQLEALRTNINAVYSAISAKGGTVPTNKNMVNMPAAINSIAQGYPNSLSYIAYDDVSRAQNYVNICNVSPMGSASHAFAASSSSSTLTALNLSRFTDFSNVLDLICTFENNTALTSLTFPNACDFSNVVSMSGTFRNTGLTALNLSGWVTSDELVTVYNMFCNSSSLASITFGSNWDTSAVKSFYGMFQGCSSLASITGLSNLSMASMTSAYGLFYNCAALTSVDFSSQTINPDFYVNASNFAYALYGLTHCTTMNLTGLKSRAISLTGSYIYGNNPAMRTLIYNGAHRIALNQTGEYELANALLNLVDTVSGSAITSLTISNPTFYTTDGTAVTAPTTVSDIWSGAALTTLNLSGWDVSNVDMTDNTADAILTNSDNLTTLDLSGWTNPDGLNFGTMIGSTFASGVYTSAAPNLTTLTLNTPSVVEVNTSGTGQASSVNAFNGTPIAAGNGHIRVPASLVSAYKAHSFWGRFANSVEAIS